MRLYLRMALEQANVVVTEAGDLKQAREALRGGTRFSALLLDLELPDGNGLDLVREAPVHSRIIALSADGSKETVLRCREAGCDRVLRKGYRPNELRTLLNDIGSRVPAPPASSKQQDELANKYLEFLSESRVTMQRAWHHRDFETLRQICHRLRGTAIHFGYAGVDTSAQALGTALATGNMQQIGAGLNKLAEQIFRAAEFHHHNNVRPKNMEKYICES